MQAYAERGEIAFDVARRGRLILPAVEQEPGSIAACVFTSVERMVLAFPNVRLCRTIRLGELATYWPEEQDLCLAIDLGHPDSLTFTSAAVRHLLTQPRN
jgi:hypothetical protein